MNDRKLIKALKSEGRKIQDELTQRRLYKRPYLLLVTLLVLAIGTMVFAYERMDETAWFVQQATSYDELLEEPLMLTAEDQEITITIEGILADDLSTYLYYNIAPVNGQSATIFYNDGFKVVNDREVFSDLYKRLDEGFGEGAHWKDSFDSYYRGGSAPLIPSNQGARREVLKLAAMTPNTGQVSFEISKVELASGEVIEGKWSFDIPYEKKEVKTLELNKTIALDLPEGLTGKLTFLRLEEGATATRLVYTEDLKQDFSLAYDGITINDTDLIPIFFGSGGHFNEQSLDFFPVQVERIKDMTLDLKGIYYEEPVLEFYALTDFPARITYEGLDMIIREVDDNPYRYEIEDLGYKDRDFYDLDIEFKFGKYLLPMSYEQGDQVLVSQDGEEVVDSYFDVYLQPEKQVRTKVYRLTSYFTNEELESREHYEFDGSSADEIRIRRERKYEYLNDELTILNKWW